MIHKITKRKSDSYYHETIPRPIGTIWSLDTRPRQPPIAIHHSFLLITILLILLLFFLDRFHSSSINNIFALLRHRAHHSTHHSTPVVVPLTLLLIHHHSLHATRPRHHLSRRHVTAAAAVADQPPRQTPRHKPLHLFCFLRFRRDVWAVLFMSERKTERKRLRVCVLCFALYEFWFGLFIFRPLLGLQGKAFDGLDEFR